MELIASRNLLSVSTKGRDRALWQRAMARCYYHYQRFRMRRAGCPREVWLTSQHARYPLICRTGSSDIHVYRQIFVRRIYAHLDFIAESDLIIDCGANVGYASAYFLSRFPNATVVAVEPDPDNFAMLVRNLAPYGSRARPIRAAVWSLKTDLMIAHQPYRDGREWSRQVVPCPPGTIGSIPAVDIDGLREATGHARVSILKIDIEGAETEVFSAENLSWLNRVDHVAIELHDDSLFGAATPVVLPALERYGFKCWPARSSSSQMSCMRASTTFASS